MPFRSRFLLLLPLLAAVVSCSDATRSPRIRTRDGTVMGTVAQLKAVGTDSVAADRRLDDAFITLSRIEALTTSYSGTSDVAHLRTELRCAVSVDTDAVLTLAAEVGAATGAAFDATAGALVHAWGYPDDPHLPDSAVVAEALTRVGPGRLRHVDGLTWEVDAGTELDLGGVAKGWGVDRAADVLAGDDGACLVSVGGDLVVRGTKPGGVPWRVGVQDPRDPSRLFETLSLSGTRAVATSGDYQRYVDVGGVRYHHLLDPHTGWPARGANSATVIGPSCALADAWATAAFVLGAEAGVAALEREPELEGVIVTIDAEGELVRYETSGFAAYRSE